MVVVASINVDCADTEVVTYLLQTLQTFCSLNHGELMRNLIPSFVSSSHARSFLSLRLFDEVD